MANLPEVNEFTAGVYQLETSDPVLGGPDGIANLQAKALTNRTLWLRSQLLDLQNNGFNGRKVRRNNLIHGVLPTSIRNAVMSGPVDNDGVPNFITATIGTKEIQLNGSPIPIRLSFAAGYDDFGQIDYPGKLTTDFTRNIETDLGMPNNSTEVTIFAEHTPTDAGGSTTISAVRTSQVFLTPNPPSGTSGIWWNPYLQIWLRYNNDFGAWATPAYVVPLARLIRNVSGNITAIVRNNYREGIEGVPSVPIGSIIASGREHTNPPAGYLHCNGAALAANVFTDLFQAIGTAYGIDGPGQFRVPDLRGEFLRGFDAGRGIDSGRVMGSSQAALVGAHKHELPMIVQAGQIQTANAPLFGSGGTYPMTHNNSGAQSQTTQNNAVSLTNNPYAPSNDGTGDNRPRNVAVNYFIRYI